MAQWALLSILVYYFFADVAEKIWLFEYSINPGLLHFRYNTETFFQQRCDTRFFTSEALI
jgi:hypothetical protein